MMASPLFLADIGGTLESLGVNVGVLIVTWIISARVTTAVLKKQIEALAAEIQSIHVTVRLLSDRIQRAESERASCELRCVKTFALKGEFAQLYGEIAGNHRETLGKIEASAKDSRESVARVHRRVDELAESVTRVETLLEKKD